MNIKYDSLKNIPRLLLEVPLQPLQGHRFQPTGFSDLGPARYQSPSGTPMLLVESNQSVANRMEAACWDEGSNALIAELNGLPYIRVNCDGKELTNSILEAHRINSEYIVKKGKKTETEFRTLFENELDYRKDRPINFNQFHELLLKYDPNSLVHGCFMEEIGGRLRVARALSGFIEASDVKAAESGGVKFNNVQPSKDGGDGESHIPYSRTEFTAKEIRAYFNLDLAQIRGFGLGESVTQLLVALSIFKILRFLSTGLRLRTACDLTIEKGQAIEIVAPAEGFELPTESDALADVAELIKKVSAEGKFASPAITQTTWPIE